MHIECTVMYNVKMKFPNFLPTGIELTSGEREVSQTPHYNVNYHPT